MRKTAAGSSSRCESVLVRSFTSRADHLSSFERRKRGSEYSYHFVGYVSFYSFFCWPDTKRLRLA